MAVHKQMNESTGANLRTFIVLLHAEHRHRLRTLLRARKRAWVRG